MAESRVAIIGIIVENTDSVEKLNQILHQYADAIIGRMGIPYRKRGISVISLALDAPQDVISALSGKIGMLPGVNAKTAYAGAATGAGAEGETCGAGGGENRRSDL
ncbi:MAG: iron-only hydrogenase system regulator [Clostridiales bacterium]|jgi:putative iron-only hydrogenase system regulator|nr:iron-only hydrogenase system regulator [Clostridiales bacterium]